MDTLFFIMMSLACWRITHLFAAEDGPLHFVYHIRKRAGAGFFGSLLDCFYCISVWVAFPFGMAAGNTWWEKLLYWWAISGATCLLEQATTSKKSSPPEMPDYKED